MINDEGADGHGGLGGGGSATDCVRYCRHSMGLARWMMAYASGALSDLRFPKKGRYGLRQKIRERVREDALNPALIRFPGQEREKRTAHATCGK